MADQLAMLPARNSEKKASFDYYISYLIIYFCKVNKTAFDYFQKINSDSQSRDIFYKKVSY